MFNEEAFSRGDEQQAEVRRAFHVKVFLVPWPSNRIEWREWKYRLLDDGRSIDCVLRYPKFINNFVTLFDNLGLTILLLTFSDVWRLSLFFYTFNLLKETGRRQICRPWSLWLTMILFIYSYSITLVIVNSHMKCIWHLIDLLIVTCFLNDDFLSFFLAKYIIHAALFLKKRSFE